MNWMPFVTQLLQTISVGTIATALYGAAKALRAVIDRKPLLFALVTSGEGSSTMLDITIRNRCPTELFVDTIEIVDPGQAVIHLKDGSTKSRAAISTAIPPYVAYAAEIPPIRILCSVRALAQTSAARIAVTVIFSRRIFARRRYTFAAIKVDQRRNLSIKI